MPNAPRKEHLEDSQNEPANSPSAPKAEPELSPEEQMVVFEQDLKENDWGHQPC